MKKAMFILVLFPCVCLAQLTEAEKKATAAFILSMHDTETGGYRVDANAKPNLRATSGAIRSLGHLKLDVKPPRLDKTADYVKSHYDASTGEFSEVAGKPDVTITSIGLMAAGQLGIAKEFPKAVDYLKANAKTFEDVRIGAAALEAGNARPEWLNSWIKLADAQLNNDGTAGRGDSQARDTASVAAMKLRLGYPIANKAKVIEAIQSGQRADGGWGKTGGKASDLESTYRVMRALNLLKEKPKGMKALNVFLAKCRNTDGGYSVEPGNPSTLSGVYYATAIGMWMEK